MASKQLGAALRQLQMLFSTGAVSNVTDDRLIQRFISERDESAFEALVERHGPMVLSVCHGVLKNPDDAQDAFQATFLVLARKADSILAGGSLGGWLYRVAYNMAVQLNTDESRHREMERRAVKVASGMGREETPGADITPALYEEVNRLPERLRLPIVLCHLEEMTHAQAAERLGWTVGTVRGRVAKARAVLRGRLARRGFALSTGAMATVLAERSAKAAVPLSWVAATVDAARIIAAGQVGTAGAVSAVLILSDRGIRAMYLMKLKAVAVFVSTTGAMMGVACLVALAVVGPSHMEAERPTQVQAEGPRAEADAPSAKASAAAPSDTNSVALTGCVLDPDGRPIDKASIRVSYSTGGFRTLETLGISGTGGRFAIRVPRAAVELSTDGQPAMAPMIVASARGFGPGIARSGPHFMDLKIRLVKDDIPIEGRVLDLEGRPVKSASIKTISIHQSPSGDLSAWLTNAQVRGSRGLWNGLVGFPFEVSAMTGPDGRFRLQGIGRERIAVVAISGPRIASSNLNVMTRQGRDVIVEDRASGGSKPLVFHAARFEHAAAPTRPIVGVVSDTGGKPLASVRVAAIVPSDENDRDYRVGLSTTTDQAGRYRLTGMPIATAYRVFAFPGEGQPYPNSHREVESNPLDPDPVTCDIVLKQGVMVRGRLTDKETGRPVAGRVMTYSFADNPLVGDYAGFAGTDPPAASTGADGRFEVVAVPGRGLLVAGSLNRKYFAGAGAEAIEGLVKEQGAAFFLTVPSQCSVSSFQICSEINPGPKDGAVTQDLQLDPGRTLKGTVIDSDGRPVSGAIAGGLSSGPIWSDALHESPDFQVIGLKPGRPRRVYVFHSGRKLAGTTLVDGNEAGPIVVRLQPWGIITGRIVTDDPRPLAKLELLGNFLPENPAPDFGMFPKDVPVGEDGQFRIEGLVPGLQYEGRVADRPKIIGSAFKGVRVAPGETKDLGVVKPSL